MPIHQPSPPERGRAPSALRLRAAMLAVLLAGIISPPAAGASEAFRPLHPDRGEAWSKPAGSPEDKAQLARIDAEVERLAALWSDSDIRFAILEDGKAQRIAKGAEWPEGLHEAIVIYREAGKVRVAVREPQSESGDWSATYFHYFDVEGRTIRFERSYARIDPFCDGASPPGGVARETARSSFAPGLRLIARSHMLKDGEDGPLTLKCDLDFQDPYTVEADWPSLRRRLKLPGGE